MALYENTIANAFAFGGEASKDIKCPDLHLVDHSLTQEKKHFSAKRQCFETYLPSPQSGMRNPPHLEPLGCQSWTEFRRSSRWSLSLYGGTDGGPGSPSSSVAEQVRSILSLLTFSYDCKMNVHVFACPRGTLDKGAMATGEKYQPARS